MNDYIIGKLLNKKKNLIINKNSQIKKVVHIFNTRDDVQSIVVLNGKKAIGLIMRDKIFFHLGTRFGFNLYIEKSVIKLMDPNPLIVDYYTPIDQVSKLTMNRPQNKIYDEVIVNKDGYYYNTMSIKDLLLKISKQRIVEARNANPLSGLPGNLTINQQINNRIQANQIFSVLYIDLDNFKAFNDTYGYQKGDQLINYTAKLLKTCAASLDNNSFVGHIGGDDFIVIVKSSMDIELAKNIIKTFNENLNQFFNPIDWKRGFVICTNRQGERCQLPLTSLSIAIVSTEALDVQNHLEISDRAAEIKRIVKKRPGSNYLKDRRQKTI